MFWTDTKHLARHTRLQASICIASVNDLIDRSTDRPTHQPSLPSYPLTFSMSVPALSTPVAMMPAFAPG